MPIRKFIASLVTGAVCACSASPATSAPAPATTDIYVAECRDIITKMEDDASEFRELAIIAVDRLGLTSEQAGEFSAVCLAYTTGLADGVEIGIKLSRGNV